MKVNFEPENFFFRKYVMKYNYFKSLFQVEKFTKTSIL